MRILLIEDDDSLGEGLRTALRRAALTVDWLRDGASALAALRDGGVDLAVLDLGLPQMDGMEVIRQARRAGVTTPILGSFVSGFCARSGRTVMAASPTARSSTPDANRPIVSSVHE